jgi:uncharacterized protein (DUF486 family)
MRAILLLTISNVFMTFAWYGHLKWFPESKEHAGLWKVVLISWGIAFFEYCFQVPGNRIGQNDEGFSTGQLKILQEIITLSVFVVFSWLFLREKLTWNYFVAFGLMAVAAAFVFVVKPAPATTSQTPEVPATGGADTGPDAGGVTSAGAGAHPSSGAGAGVGAGAGPEAGR